LDELPHGYARQHGRRATSARVVQFLSASPAASNYLEHKTFNGMGLNSVIADSQPMGTLSGNVIINKVITAFILGLLYTYKTFEDTAQIQ